MGSRQQAIAATAELDDPSALLYDHGNDDEPLAGDNPSEGDNAGGLTDDLGDDRLDAISAEAAQVSQNAKNAAAAEAQATATAGVAYVILEGVKDGKSVAYREITRVTARNAEHAIRTAVEGYAGEDDLTILAVPERSFRPLTVKVKVERSVAIS